MLDPNPVVDAPKVFVFVPVVVPPPNKPPAVVVVVAPNAGLACVLPKRPPLVLDPKPVFAVLLLLVPKPPNVLVVPVLVFVLFPPNRVLPVVAPKAGFAPKPELAVLFAPKPRSISSKSFDYVIYP